MNTVTNGTTSANVNSGSLAAIAARTAAPLGDAGFRMQMEPANILELNKVAHAFAKIGLCGVQNAEEALAKLLTGREIGLTMMQSMRGIHIIEGRPSIDASLMQAMCLASPLCEDFEQIVSDGERCVFRVKRKGRATAHEYEFTMVEARQALLVDRGKDPKQNNWNKYPKRMLEARAKSLAARSEFPDVLFGMYSREEMEDALFVESEGRTIQGDALPSAPGSSPGVVDEVVAVARAERDQDAEGAELKEEINAAKTAEQKRAVRAKVRAFVQDVGEPWASDIKTFYNLVHGGAKRAAAEAPPPPPSAPAAPAAASEPDDDGVIQ
jgi:hypothetical protein